MSKKKKKFTISKELGFRMGRVVFHRELDPNADGGGYWFYDQEMNRLYLYSSSYDFGACTQEMIDSVMDEINDKFKTMQKPEFTFRFEPNEDKYLLEILCEDMDSERAMELVEKNDWV